MFENFTEKALNVILLAREESRGLGYSFVGVEQIFLGLLREQTGAAARAFQALGVDIDDMRSASRQAIGYGTATNIPEVIPFSLAGKRSLKRSLKIARNLGSVNVCTNHLLLALIMERSCTIGRFIESNGVDLNLLQKMLKQQINEDDVVESLEFSPDSDLTSLIQILNQLQKSPIYQDFYPLLYKNLDKLNLNLLSSLINWEENIVEKYGADSNQVLSIGKRMGKLAVALEDLPFGDRVDNTEIEISIFQVVLTIFTVDDFPNEWGQTNFYLARAYRKRFFEKKELEDTEKAIVCFERSLSIATLRDNPDIWYEQGKALADVGSITSAINSYDRALELNPNLSHVWFDKGFLAQMELGNHEEATIYFQKALELDSSDVKVLNHLGIAFLYFNRPEEALSHINSALEIDPDFITIRFNRARLLKKMSRFEEALTDAEYILDLEPNHCDVLHFRGYLLVIQQRYREALTSYEQLLLLDPDRAEAWLEKACILLLIWGEPVNVLTEYFSCLLGMSSIETQQIEDTEKAIVSIHKSWELNPSDPNVLEIYQPLKEFLENDCPLEVLTSLIEKLTREEHESTVLWLQELYQRKTEKQKALSELNETLESVRSNLLQYAEGFKTGSFSQELQPLIESQREINERRYEFVVRGMRESKYDDRQRMYQLFEQNIEVIEDPILPITLSSYFCAYWEDLESIKDRKFNLRGSLFNIRDALFRGNSLLDLVGDTLSFCRLLSDFQQGKQLANEFMRKPFIIVYYQIIVKLGARKKLWDDVEREGLLDLDSLPIKLRLIDEYLNQISSLSLKKSSDLELLAIATTLSSLGRCFFELYTKGRSHFSKVEDDQKYCFLCLSLSQKIWELTRYRKNREAALEWANNNIHLGNHYTKIGYYQATASQNYEEAISCFEKALEVYRKYRDRDNISLTLRSLGSSFRGRIQGNKLDNLNRAIDCYTEALELTDRSRSPDKWALTQNNMGNIYAELIPLLPQDRRLACGVKIYSCYYEASQVYQALGWVEEQVTTQKLLTVFKAYESAYEEEKQREGFASAAGFGEQDIRRVTEKMREISELFGLEDMPSPEIMFKQINEERQQAIEQEFRSSEYIDRQIESLESHLQRLNSTTSPIEWIINKIQLGELYLLRCEFNPEKLESLQLSLRNYEAGISYLQEKETYPLLQAEARTGLAKTYQSLKQYDKAYETLELAIDILESSRSSFATSSVTEEEKQKFSESHAQSYLQIVDTCMSLGRVQNKIEYYRKAVEYAERSKARNLVELLANRNIEPDRTAFSSPEDYQRVCRKLRQFRQEIPALQRQIEVVSSSRLEDANSTRLKQLQAQINEKYEGLEQLLTYINEFDRKFKYTQQVQAIAFSEIQSLLGSDEAIIEWYDTNKNWYAFIITSQPSTPVICWQYREEEVKALVDLIDNYISTYPAYSTSMENSQQWINNLHGFLSRFSSLLHIEELIERYLLPIGCKKLILVPHRFLHILPIHALPLRDGSCLLDRFDKGVSYAPSCQILQIACGKQHSELSRILAIQNPTQNLAYADIEAKAISSLFDSVEVLVKEKATKAALLNGQNLSDAHCIHFACHGSFNVASPLESTLILANEERLTLSDIFGISLSQSQLVTLSACETGIVDLRSLSDEYIGLPSGFLFAGSPNVASSLWTVDDLSTAFLMIQFYRNLQNGLTAALALNQAQLWLRDITKAELQVWMTANSLPLDPTMRQNISRRLHKCQDDQKPFQHPFYWAAFCAIGRN